MKVATAKYPLRSSGKSHRRSEDPETVHANATWLLIFFWKEMKSEYVTIRKHALCYSLVVLQTPNDAKWLKTLKGGGGRKEG